MLTQDEQDELLDTVHTLDARHTLSALNRTSGGADPNASLHDQITLRNQRLRAHINWLYYEAAKMTFQDLLEPILNEPVTGIIDLHLDPTDSDFAGWRATLKSEFDKLESWVDIWVMTGFNDETNGLTLGMAPAYRISSSDDVVGYSHRVRHYEINEDTAFEIAQDIITLIIDSDDERFTERHNGQSPEVHNAALENIHLLDPDNEADRAHIKAMEQFMLNPTDFQMTPGEAGWIATPVSRNSTQQEHSSPEEL